MNSVTSKAEKMYSLLVKYQADNITQKLQTLNLINASMQAFGNR